MGKKVLALVLMTVMLGSLAVYQGYATFDWGSSVNLGDVKIGVIIPDSVIDYRTYTLVLKLAEQDINTKLRMYSATAHFTFDIRVSGDLNGLVSQFHDNNVDLIIGGFFSGQAMGVLPFINSNKMLLFSPTSTYPDPVLLQNDGFFRMCPNDSFYVKVIDDILYSKGIQDVIILYNSNGSGDYNRNNYLSIPNHKVNILEQVPFVVGNEDTALQHVASIIPIGHKVAILQFGTDLSLYDKAINYPTVSKLPWFSDDPCDINIQLYAPSSSAKLHLYSPQQATPPEALTQFNSLQTRISTIMDHTLAMYEADTYDIAWVIAKSVLTAKSAIGSDVIKVLPAVSGSYNGVTGYCKLDVNGDRVNSYFNIMGYYLKEPYSNPLIGYCKSYGYCDYNSKKVVWYSYYP